jgi:arylsulfatase A-like enzyme
MTALEGAITRMDSAAGRVLAALDRAGRAERALVVVTTDHGLAMPRAKCTLYDPGLEVALIVVPADIQLGPIFRANPSLYSTDRPNVVELYDLEADPLEEHNLAGSRNLKAVEEELSAKLWRWMRETDDPLLNGPVASPRYRQAMQP